jgi:hypothetical protein
LCCIFQTPSGLKGSRKLQYGGIALASSQGNSISASALQTAPYVSTGNSFGNGDAVGTSNGFATSALGQAVATGTSGGNSTADSQLSVLSAPSIGTISAVGNGGGAAGGNAVFGPSLAAAIRAATPLAAAPAPEVVVDTSSKGGNSNQVPAAPAAPTAPAFMFDPAGLPTGGGGGGFGIGSGITLGTVDRLDGPDGVDEAYGNALANGFGFGVGSGLAVNNGGEQAGGQGGGTALGQGAFTFELDEVTGATFANSGVTKSDGGAGAYVGFNPPAAQIFGAFITPAPAATP